MQWRDGKDSGILRVGCIRRHDVDRNTGGIKVRTDDCIGVSSLTRDIAAVDAATVSSIRVFHVPRWG